MLCEMLGGNGSLTGVDVARHRLAACRTMLRKYSLGDVCRLFVCDGTSFSVLPFRSNYESGIVLSTIWFAPIILTENSFLTAKVLSNWLLRILATL